jgi:hypothetical protein
MKSLIPPIKVIPNEEDPYARRTSRNNQYTIFNSQGIAELPYFSKSH